MKSYYIIAGVAVAALVALGASSFISSMTPYVVSFDDVRASTADKIQVPGDVVRAKTTYDKERASLVFSLKDPKGEEMEVVYQGTRPANFDQANRVVAIGKYRDGAFRAEQLLVKCPSKYQK